MELPSGPHRQCGSGLGHRGGSKVAVMNDRTERDSLQALLYALEIRLLDPHIRRSSEDVAALLADDFLEIGASGRVFDRDELIKELARERPFFWTISDFVARPLAPDIIMVTYRLVARTGSERTPRRSLRTSIWKKSNDAWRMVFHQGTAVPEHR